LISFCICIFFVDGFTFDPLKTVDERGFDLPNKEENKARWPSGASKPVDKSPNEIGSSHLFHALFFFPLCGHFIQIPTSTQSHMFTHYKTIYLISSPTSKTWYHLLG
jgi:hypothetical protein